MDYTMTLPDNSPCPSAAEHIIAWPMLGMSAMFVAPYCADHAAEMKVDQGGVPACGPALSKDAVPIEGIHS